MSFPPKVKQEVLVASGRHCCLCHKFCALKIELHHIVERAAGGPDTADNCIPLCFDCHGDMRSYDHKHPKGTKYTADELRAHRDAWYAKVASSGGAEVNPDHLAMDRDTFGRLRELLPWEGPMNFIKDANFAGFSFPLNAIRPFRDFLYECDDPSFEFIDADLEALRAQLQSFAHDLSGAISQWTFPVETGGDRNSVPPDWEILQPETFKKAVGELHTAADGVHSTYCALVRMARRKLAVA